MSEDLKPCPFCGGKNIRTTVERWDIGKYEGRTYCDDCNSKGGIVVSTGDCTSLEVQQESQKRWNKRECEARLRRENEKLREGLEFYAEDGHMEGAHDLLGVEDGTKAQQILEEGNDDS